MALPKTFLGDFKTAPQGGYTLKAYDANNNNAVVYVKPGVYTPGISATNTPVQTQTQAWTPPSGTVRVPDVASLPNYTNTVKDPNGVGIYGIPKAAPVPASLPASSMNTGSGTVPTAETPSNSGVDSFMSSLKVGNSDLNTILNQSNTNISELQSKQSGVQQQLLDAIKGLGGKGQAVIDEQNRLGLPDMQKQLADLNTTIAQKTAAFNQMSVDNQGRPVLTSMIGGRESLIARQKAVEVGGLASVAQAMQGNISAAQATAKQTVDLQFEPQEAEINSLKQQLEFISGDLSAADKKRAEQLQIALAERENEVAQAKEDKTNILNIAMEVAKNGLAPASVYSQISNAKSVEEAMNIAGKYLAPTQNDKFQYVQTGVDDYGNPIYGTFNQSTGEVNGAGYSGPVNSSGPGVVTTSTGDKYDIASYATDPTHEAKIQGILSKIGQMKSVSQMDQYIQRVAPGSPVTGQMIANAAGKYGVSWEAMMAIMQQDSSFGTAGKAVRTFNPGNVGNTDSGATVNYGNWQTGVDAVAKNLSGRKVNGSTTTNDNNVASSWAKQILSGQTTLANVPQKLRSAVVVEMSKIPSPTDSAAESKAKEKITLIDSLLTSKGLNSSVGPTVLTRHSIADWLTGAKSNFIAGVQQLVSQDTLQTLLDLKKGGGTLGALSDQERLMLQGAATKIGTWAIHDKNGNVSGYRASQNDFKAELKRIKELAEKAITQSTMPEVQKMADGTQWIQNSDGTYTQI